jgi:Lyzozyme M1 (1,4-beta-N-acetylmuramidase)
MTVWVPGTVIDVSKWQSSLPNLTGVLGVIARAGIGTKPDAMFTTHIRNAREAGKWVGSYWFNWGDLSVSEQVDAYIAREKEVGGVSLHTIDWEGTDGFTAAQTADFIRIYRARTGQPISLYASEGRFRDLGQDWNWIANYSSEPDKAYDMWQYGPFRGVDGNHAKQRILDLVAGADDMARYINLKACDPTTLRRVAVKANQDWFYLDGSRGGSFSANATVPVLGRSDTDGSLLTIIINTGVPYPNDDELRLTAVNVKAEWTATTAAPPEPSPDGGLTQADVDKAVADATLAAQVTIDAQAAIIAAEKEARIAAEQSLAATYYNIDALKG